LLSNAVGSFELCGRGVHLRRIAENVCPSRAGLLGIREKFWWKSRVPAIDTLSRTVATSGEPYVLAAHKLHDEVFQVVQVLQNGCTGTHL
jgi:hypothetical protein